MTPFQRFNPAASESPGPARNIGKRLTEIADDLHIDIHVTEPT